MSSQNNPYNISRSSYATLRTIPRSQTCAYAACFHNFACPSAWSTKYKISASISAARNDSFGLQPACHRRADLPAFLDQCFGGAEDVQESSDCWRAAILHFTPAQDLAKDLAGVPELDK